MNSVVVIFFLLLLGGVFLSYRWGGGAFSVSFLVMLYMGFLYLGALHFYFKEGHYTFIFVFVMVCFYLLGMLIASKAIPFKRNFHPNEPLKLHSPLHTSVLKISLSIVFILALVVAFYRVKVFGIPLLAQTWYTIGIRSTTGIVNRLMYNVGVVSLVIIALITYALYKSEREKFFLFMSLMSFICYEGFEILQGGKSAAIMPLVLIGMTIFYANRKTPKKFMIAFGVIVLVLILFIGVFWAGIPSLYRIVELYYERLTNRAILHLDYLLYNWAPDHHYQFGRTIILEVKRIIAQVTSTPKEPLFNEIIGNLKQGYPTNLVTGLSPEISIFGMGFANFGIVGAILTAVIFGFVVQWLNLWLLSRGAADVFSFIVCVYFMFKLLGLARGGNILISFEKFLFEVTPVFTFILFSYMYLALLWPSTLIWRKLSYGA